MDETGLAMHQLGSTFVADLAQPGSLQATLRSGGLQSQTTDAAGDPTHIHHSFRSGEHQAALISLESAVKSAEGIDDVLTVEVSGTPSGDYSVSYSTDLPSLPARVVFGRRRGYPNDPVAGIAGRRTDWVVDVGDAATLDEVAALPDPLVIRSVHLRQVDRLHLRDLGDLAHLRSIQVLDRRLKAHFVDLDIPAGLPVEHVRIVAERFDPQLLANTPTLTYVALAGNLAPVSVGALAELPKLAWLELAGATVADIESIARFPALRVLSLNAQQWDVLLDTAWARGRLVAAELGRASLPEATTWLTAVRGGHPVARHRTIEGRAKRAPIS